MSEMEFQKVYKAKVESVRQQYVDVTGMRHYEVWFRNGKMMYYQRSQKQVMLIVPGNTIRFTAHRVEPDLFWVIDDVLESYNDEQRLILYHYYDEKKRREEGMENFL